MIATLPPWLIQFGIIVIVPMIRSLAGWANAALKDKKITKFEWKKLIQTEINVGLTGIMILCGASGAGIDITAIGAVATAFVMDKFFGK